MFLDYALKKGQCFEKRAAQQIQSIICELNKAKRQKHNFSTLSGGEALRDDPNNDCEGDY